MFIIDCREKRPTLICISTGNGDAIRAIECHNNFNIITSVNYPK